MATRLWEDTVDLETIGKAKELFSAERFGDLPPRLVAVTEWFRGTCHVIVGTFPTEEEAYSVGKMLALLHNISMHRR